MADAETPDGATPFDPGASRDADIIRAVTRVCHPAVRRVGCSGCSRCCIGSAGVSAGLGSGALGTAGRGPGLHRLPAQPPPPGLRRTPRIGRDVDRRADPTARTRHRVLRLTRWTANALVVIALLSVATPVFGVSEGLDDVGTIAFRLGGAIAAFAISTLCREAGRNAPGG